MKIELYGGPNDGQTLSINYPNEFIYIPVIIDSVANYFADPIVDPVTNTVRMHYSSSVRFKKAAYRLEKWRYSPFDWEYRYLYIGIR